MGAGWTKGCISKQNKIKNYILRTFSRIGKLCYTCCFIMRLSLPLAFKPTFIRATKHFKFWEPSQTNTNETTACCSKAGNNDRHTTAAEQRRRGDPSHFGTELPNKCCTESVDRKDGTCVLMQREIIRNTAVCVDRQKERALHIY